MTGLRTGTMFGSREKMFVACSRMKIACASFIRPSRMKCALRKSQLTLRSGPSCTYNSWSVGLLATGCGTCEMISIRRSCAGASYRMPARVPAGQGELSYQHWLAALMLEGQWCCGSGLRRHSDRRQRGCAYVPQTCLGRAGAKYGR